MLSFIRANFRDLNTATNCFCESFLVNNNITYMSECVVLLIDSIFNDGIRDIDLIFTYIAPGKSLFTPQKMMMEL